MKKQLAPERQTELLEILQQRFEKNMSRHPKLQWDAVKKQLESTPEKLWTINEMEITEGEPDAVQLTKDAKNIAYADCSPETPKRRSLCYDKQAWDARKEHKPANNALDVAKDMGVTLLNEEQYRALQNLGEFDKKTSSWILTPEPIRKLGGALFCDRRYNHVFTYHNGAESYYAARGFRGILEL